MAAKRAYYYSYGDDELCSRTKHFIEEAGVILNVRDLEKDPMSEEELRQLLGNLEISHFLNPLSDSFSKHKMDKELPDRDKVIELMSKDHTLIRRPIIKSSRLIMVGCNQDKVAEMLQIGANGEGPPPEKSSRSRSGSNQRGRGSKGGSRRAMASAKG